MGCFLEAALTNMTCFSEKSGFGAFWTSYSFLHPYYKKMKSFTKTLFENGVFDMFENMEKNGLMLRTRTRRIGSQESSSFIKLKETQAIFYISISIFTATIAVFLTEIWERPCFFDL